MNHTDRFKYVIISPVKDEQNYIQSTIESVIKQTQRPLKWIIVDDASKDLTPKIVKDYCKKYSWIEYLRIKRGSRRQPGSAVIYAFNQGLKMLKDDNSDFIVKLDCDVRFGADYFHKIFLKFSKDANLGIASGIYLEKNENDWAPIIMPDYHTAGASKIVRKKCFEQIGGFYPLRGWDTIDEIKAQINGWKTCHFKEIEFYHLKNEGSGIGSLRTNAMQGEIFYLTGGSKTFFLMKILYRMIYGKPFVVGGLVMFIGFLKPMILRRNLLLSPNEAKFYKKMLNRRILDKINKLVCFARHQNI